MKITIASVFCLAAVLFSSTWLRAQNPVPHWASMIYSSTSDIGSQFELVTDKQGNIYILAGAPGGYMNADGHATTRADATTLLVSWDCHHNFRWMKAFGGIDNKGMYLQTDSMGGVYISGIVANHGASSGSTYWDADTAITLAANSWMEYIIKYDTNGSFQWLRVPASYTNTGSNYGFATRFSVTSSGEVFWFSLLEPGTYNGGSFTISTLRYYAVQYDASGSYQSVTSLDMTPPQPDINIPIWFYFNAVTNHFYTFLTHEPDYGTLTIGSTTIVPPSTPHPRTAVLAAFNRQGGNLWVQQGGTARNTRSGLLAFGKDGTLFLTKLGDVGGVFCGDTATNAFVPSTSSISYCIMALDTNAGLIWSNHLNGSIAEFSAKISVEGNTLAATGAYSDTLSIGNDTIVNSNLFYRKGYLLRLNAATGTVLQLDTVYSTPSATPGLMDQFYTTAINRNGDVYVSGNSINTLYFGNDTLSTSAFANNGKRYRFLLKYKNVNCDCDLLQPAFNITGIISFSTYQFSYTGQTPYTALSWDFGDGSPAVSGANPSHTYTSTGVFPICVTATNSCGDNTTCKYVTVEEVSHTERDAGLFSKVRIYPNPAKDRLVISHLEPGTTVELLDGVGRRIKKENAENSDLHIHIEGLSAGIHLIRFTDKEGRQGGRVFVKE